MQALCFTLCGLLASCLCSWASSPTFSVTQSPSTVRLKKGGEVRLTCSWNRSISDPKVTWIKGDQKINQSESIQINNNRATLMINKADRNRAGFYICEVTQDIPQLVQERGTGSEVIYETEQVNGTDPSRHGFRPRAAWYTSVKVLSASVSAAALILSVCVGASVWRLKRGCGQSGKMVIREGPPSEGEEPEHSEDGESSSTSRGSAQWYMVPVYESYFDVQRCDERQRADSDPAAASASAPSNPDSTRIKDAEQEVGL